MRQNLKTSKKGVGGSRFTMYKNSQPDSGWDNADAPNSWYGAGAVEISGPSNSMTIGTISSSEVLGQPAVNDPRRAEKLSPKSQIFGLRLTEMFEQLICQPSH